MSSHAAGSHDSAGYSTVPTPAVDPDAGHRYGPPTRAAAGLTDPPAWPVDPRGDDVPVWTRPDVDDQLDDVDDQADDRPRHVLTVILAAIIAIVMIVGMLIVAGDPKAAQGVAVLALFIGLGLTIAFRDQWTR